MIVGDLVRIVKNDMSLVHPSRGEKNNKFFDQIGTVVKVYERQRWDTLFSWFRILLPAGLYEAREDTLEKL